MEPELHPQNRSFEWKMPAGPYRRISEQQARSYDERGFFVLEDAFPADTVREVTEALDPAEAEVEGFLSQLEGKKMFIARAGEITFTTHIVTRSDVARDFCRSTMFQDLGHDLIGPDVRLYWDQAVYKKPETAAEFPWHQDNGYTFVVPQQYLTCWVALTDATVENGCPWVVPGIHKRGTLKHEKTDLGMQCLTEVEGAIAVPLRAGSIAVFSSLTPHRTGPNTTDDIRKAYIVQMAPDGAVMVTDEETPCDDPARQFFILRDGKTPTDA